jgi:uncharacterized membrane protein (DUF106 family)
LSGFEPIISIISSAIFVGIAWGIQKSKLDNLMETVKELKEEVSAFQKHYVTHKHLDAVIPHLQRTLDEVRSDIKQLLVVVHNSNGKKSSNKDGN